jgi:VWFA-related protein
MPMNAAADRWAIRKRGALLRFGLLALLIGATGWSGGAGQDGGQGVQPQRVQVFFTACDKERHPVIGLTKEEIRISEGRSEQHVESLAVRNVPLRLGLLIDASGSRREQFPGSERGPAIVFLRSVVGPGDLAFVVAFNNDSQPLSKLTGNAGELELGVVRATSGYRGRSALYDSVKTASKILANQDGRRLLIVVSDGMDNASYSDWAGTIRAARETRTTVHMILIPLGSWVSASRHLNQRAGEQLAEETGGVVVRVKRAEDFADAFDAVTEIVSNEYVASYVPAKPPRKGEFREVRIQSSRKEVKFISKAGYYTAK